MIDRDCVTLKTTLTIVALASLAVIFYLNDCVTTDVCPINKDDSVFVLTCYYMSFAMALSSFSVIQFYRYVDSIDATAAAVLTSIIIYFGVIIFFDFSILFDANYIATAAMASVFSIQIFAVNVVIAIFPAVFFQSCYEYYTLYRMKKIE